MTTLLQHFQRFALAAALVGCAGLLAVRPLAAQERHAPGTSLGVDTTGLNRGVRPQDDFAAFVNGRWLRQAQIAPDRSSTGSFMELRDAAQVAVRGILDEAAASPGATGSNRQKIGDLFASYMDSTAVEKAGLRALETDLAALRKVASVKDLAAAFARAARLGGNLPFRPFVGPDARNSRMNIVSIGQAGLGLPDRDYYLRDDAKYVDIRKAYRTYVAQVLSSLGTSNADGAADLILALETRMARAQWDRVRRRDPIASYNKMTVAELQALTPSFDWRAFLKDAGMGAADTVVVEQPDYLKAVDGILTSTPADAWRDYLSFGVVNAYAGAIPPYAAERFAIYGRALRGVQVPPPRWQDAVDAVQRGLGEAVGQIYVARYFKADAKQRMDALVKNLLAAFDVGIDSLEWMSPPTRAAAKAKLARFGVKIGYPDKWRDYSSLQIKRGDLLGDLLRVQAFQYQDRLDQLGKPVDRARWRMTPQTVNASYNPSNNDITFPAAILQPPFFNVAADDAVNYGAIGAVIGHEISHGFDDEGAQYDGDGNLRNWWTADDENAFHARTGALAAQYSAYTPIDTMHINGKATLGENIGDLSGLAVAYRAYHMSLGGKEAPVIDGFTGDQRFFMGWAQVWRAKTRDAALRNQLLTDPHSPDAYRAFVPLTNIDAFYRAWNIQPGDKLYRAPGERVKIW